MQASLPPSEHGQSLVVFLGYPVMDIQAAQVTEGHSHAHAHACMGTRTKLR